MQDTLAERKVSPGAIFATLSLICVVPDVVLKVANGSIHYPDAFAPFVIWTIFLSPVAGLVLALIAAKWDRGWLLLAAAWIVMLGYGIWFELHHPFDL
jgi:hypothetical protein